MSRPSSIVLTRFSGRGPDDALGDLYDKALAWRDAMERAKDKVLYEEPDGTPYNATDEFLSQISEEAEEFLETHGEQAADAFYKIAKGEGTPLRTHVEAWLTDESGRVAGQTISQHRAALKAFLSWAGVGVLAEDVRRKLAGEYVSHLIAPTSGLSRQTAKRHLSSLSSFWGWLQSRGFVDKDRDNPWLGQGIGKKASRGGRRRKLWTDHALVKVLSGNYTPRYTETLRDLTRLALVTGARLDELCALIRTRIEGRVSDLDVLGPSRHEPPAHDLRDTLAVFCVRRDKHRVGGRYIPRRLEVRRRRVRAELQPDFDFRIITRKAHSPAHARLRTH